MILAFDPGKRAVACSVWRPDGALYCAKLVKGADKIFAEGPEVWRRTAEAAFRFFVECCSTYATVVAFERPGAYRSDSPKRTLDIQNLIAVDAWLCALINDRWGQFGPITYRAFYPNEWQGTLKRPDPWREETDPVVAMVKTRLPCGFASSVEWPAPSLRHNVWDCLGIGLKATGQFERKMYYGKGLKDAKT